MGWEDQERDEQGRWGAGGGYVFNRRGERVRVSVPIDGPRRPEDVTRGVASERTVPNHVVDMVEGHAGGTGEVVSSTATRTEINFESGKLLMYHANEMVRDRAVESLSLHLQKQGEGNLRSFAKSLTDSALKASGEFTPREDGGWKAEEARTEESLKNWAKEQAKFSRDPYNYRKPK